MDQSDDMQQEPADVTGAPVEKNPGVDGLGICLSGGGYRAALFHLGVLRCLHELGILQKVVTMSSVSGGSILSAYVAKRMVELGVGTHMHFNDWERDVSAGFRSFVKNDIRTFPVILNLLWNWLLPNWRVKHLQRNYDKLLLTLVGGNTPRALTLGDLPVMPNFVFCATDLTFGINFEFERTQVGDYQIGYAKKPDWPVALAVTASSCFPPLFGPLKLGLTASEFRRGKYRGADRDELVANLTTTDGGVYDNIGFEPIKRHKMVIVSDGGSPFGYMGTAGPIRRLMRYLPVIMNQVGSLRRRIFFTGITKGWHNGVFVDIAHDRQSPPSTTGFDGYVDPKVRAMIAGVRTDLDSFTSDEAGILENHGYFEMYRRVLSKLPELIPSGFKPTTPHPELVSNDRVFDSLKASHKRSFFFVRI